MNKNKIKYYAEKYKFYVTFSNTSNMRNKKLPNKSRKLKRVRRKKSWCMNMSEVVEEAVYSDYSKLWRAQSKRKQIEVHELSHLSR